MNDETRTFGINAVTSEDRKILVGIEDDLLQQSIPVQVVLHNERDGVCYDVVFIAEKAADRARNPNNIRVSFWDDFTGLIVAIGEKIKTALQDTAVAIADASSPIFEGAKEILTAATDKTSEKKSVELAKKGLEHYVAPLKEEIKPLDVAQRPPVVEIKRADSPTTRETPKIAETCNLENHRPSVATIEEDRNL